MRQKKKRGLSLKLSCMTIGFTLESVKAFEAGLCSEERVRADFICLLDTLKQMDVRYLDISTRELTIIGEDEAAAEMEERGLRVGCLIFFDHDMLNPHLEYLPEECRKTIMIAKKFRTEYILNVPRILPETRELPRSEWEKMLLPRMENFSQCAREAGITAVVENRQDLELPLCTSRELDMLFQAVPSMELCYDSANMLLACEDPLEFYDHFQEKISCMHIKDMVEIDANCTNGNMSCDGRRLAPAVHGTGLVNFAEIVKRMQKQMVQGIVTLECLPVAGKSPSPEELRRAWQWLRQLLVTIGIDNGM